MAGMAFAAAPEEMEMHCEICCKKHPLSACVRCHESERRPSDDSHFVCASCVKKKWLVKRLKVLRDNSGLCCLAPNCPRIVDKEVLMKAMRNHPMMGAWMLNLSFATVRQTGESCSYAPRPFKQMRFRVEESAETDDPAFKRLVDYEKAILVNVQKTFDELDSDLTGLASRFLDKCTMIEATKILYKRQRTFGEEGYRHMETLDAFELATEETCEDQRCKNRGKRKELIDGIHWLLNRNDVNVKKLEEMLRSRDEEDATNDPVLKRLVEYENSSLLLMQKTFDHLATDLNNLQHKFDKSTHDEGSRMLSNRQRGFHEEGFRHMEALDAIQLAAVGTTEEQLAKNRRKRKALIDGIESLLSQNDANMKTLAELNRVIANML